MQDTEEKTVLHEDCRKELIAVRMVVLCCDV